MLGVAPEVFQMVSGGPGELIEESSGDVIILSNLGHFAVDALIDPSGLCQWRYGFADLNPGVW